MDIAEVREHLYDITADFFKGAAIIWAETITTRPEPPYVTLKTGGVKRTNFPITDEDGRRYYPSSVTWEVNLYTQGKPVTIGTKVTGNYSNTAPSDLMEFFDFIDSEYMVDIGDRGLSIMLEGQVKDLSFLENDVAYRYRAMGEATVSFPLNAEGYYGEGGITIPNYSGGGTADMQVDTPDIGDVTIEYQQEV